MIRRSSSLALLLTSFVMGCGTQIGNPGGGSKDLAPWYRNPRALFVINTHVFVQTIDAMTAGDYAYSQSGGSRVVTDRSCPSADPGAVEATTRSNHSVADRLGDWTADTALQIDRSYQDRWTRDGKPLPCNPDFKLLSFSELELVNNSLSVSSRVEDNSVRSLSMINLKTGEGLKAAFSGQSRGERQIDFDAVMAGDSVRLNAKVLSSVTSRLLYREDNGKENTLSLFERDADALSVEITREDEGRIVRRHISDANLRTYVGERGAYVETSYKGLVWEGEGGCVPSAGSYSFRAFDEAGALQASYAITFPILRDLNMKSLRDESSLTLLPFACVLKEG